VSIVQHREEEIDVENEILQLAASQSLWAILFVWLLFYVLKENSKREKNFQDIILALTEKLDTLESIKENLVDIKDGLHNIGKIDWD